MSLSKKLFFIFCQFVPLISAQAQYRFDHWTTDTGLPQNSVYAVTQTCDGYLWLATVDGLARFDGVRFTVFNKSNSPGISSNRFVCLYEDAQGDLWAGTEDGGITRLHQGHFTSFSIEQGLPSLRVIWITGDREGNAAALFSNAKILRWSGENFLLFDSTTAQSAPVLSEKNCYTFCLIDDNARQIICFVSGELKKFSLADGLPSMNLTFKGGGEDRNGRFGFQRRMPDLSKLRTTKSLKFIPSATACPEIRLL